MFTIKLLFCSVAQEQGTECTQQPFLSMGFSHLEKKEQEAALVDLQHIGVSFPLKGSICSVQMIHQGQKYAHCYTQS
jgi:hypothetical protein